MSNALSTLNGNLAASVFVASLSGRTVCAAETSLFHILVTPRMLAKLAFGSMGNAKPALHDTVRTVVHRTLATDALAGATGRQLAIRISVIV
jgi:predicted thioesterase